MKYDKDPSIRRLEVFIISFVLGLIIAAVLWLGVVISVKTLYDITMYDDPIGVATYAIMTLIVTIVIYGVFYYKNDKLEIEEPTYTRLEDYA